MSNYHESQVLAAISLHQAAIASLTSPNLHSAGEISELAWTASDEALCRSPGESRELYPIPGDDCMEPCRAERVNHCTHLSHMYQVLAVIT